MTHPLTDGSRLDDPDRKPDRDPEASGPAAALLVRVDATAADWVHLLPAAPPGIGVTVTISDEDLLGEARPLVARGYTLAGSAPPVLVAPGRAAADLFVPVPVADAWPGWWAAVTAVADRVFATAHGPVARLFAPVVAVHADAGAFSLL